MEAAVKTAADVAASTIGPTAAKHPDTPIAVAAPSLEIPRAYAAPLKPHLPSAASRRAALAPTCRRREGKPPTTGAVGGAVARVGCRRPGVLARSTGTAR